MSRDVIQKLQSLKNGEANPRAEWLKNNREFLLSQIRNTVSDENNADQWKGATSALSIFFPQKFVYNVLRPIAILFIVISVASSGWITTVDAAYEALPGDWLYPAKRVAEKTRVTMAVLVGDEKTETKLHAEYAKRRAVETKKIIADPGKQDKVAQSMTDLKKEINNVSDKLEAIKSNPDAKEMAEVAKDVSQNTEQIKNVLKEVKDDLLVSTSTEGLAFSKELNETKDLAKEVTIKAVEVVVTKHLEGDKTVTSEEVKDTIDKLLQNVSTEIVTTKQNVESATTITDAVKFDLAGKVIPVVPTTTPTLKQQTEQATGTAEVKVAEAREFLVSGDLAGAVNKLIEANVANTEVEKMNDLAVGTINSVAPVIGIPTVEILNTPTTTFVSSTIIVSSTVKINTTTRSN